MCFKQGGDKCCNMLDQGYIKILKTILKQQKQTFFLKLQNLIYSNKRHLQSKTRYLTRRTRVSWCKISIISPLNLSNLAKIIIPNTEKLNYGRALKTNALDWIMDIRVNRILAWSFKVLRHVWSTFFKRFSYLLQNSSKTNRLIPNVLDFSLN